jgi:hypothetical protein
MISRFFIDRPVLANVLATAPTMTGSAKKHFAHPRPSAIWQIVEERTTNAARRDMQNTCRPFTRCSVRSGPKLVVVTLKEIRVVGRAADS